MPEQIAAEESGSLLDRAVRTANETHALAFGPGVLAETGRIFAEQFPGSTVLVVADENTFAAAGEPVLASLRQAGVRFAADPFVFPGTPTLFGDYTNTTIVREQLAQHPDAIACSIAAGALNDVTKLAAGELGRGYLNVCTAASVDGYTAFGASISRDGFKITRNCPAPVAVVADTMVMAAAPSRLTATGYGDLIEKIPAGADWILADELGVEPIDQDVWDLVQPASRQALARPEEIAAGGIEAISALAEANLLSGLAMQAAQSSRPASGAGHLFSHVWEMEGHGQKQEPPLSHGFKVGIGTIASCALWEAVLALDLTRIGLDALVASAPSREQVEQRCHDLLDPRFADAAVAQSLAKYTSGADLAARLELVRSRWTRIRERSAAQLIGPQEVVDRLRTVGAPHHPALIGIDIDRLHRTYFQTQLIRSRYTVLDLLAETGLLQQVVDGLFAADGFWAGHPRP